MNGLRKAVLLFVMAAVLIGTTIAPTPAVADGFGRAGVVVVHGDGSVQTRCVALDQAEINGYKLLKRSTFAYRIAQFGFGRAVCWLDGQGVKTTKPDHCFDNPKGKSWSYWISDKGDTATAESGVGFEERAVAKGSVDYWIWHTYPAPAPKLRTVSDICR